MPQDNAWAFWLSGICWVLGLGVLIYGLQMEISVSTSEPRVIYGITINSLSRVANISLVEQKISAIIVASLMMLTGTICFVGSILWRAIVRGQIGEESTSRDPALLLEAALSTPPVTLTEDERIAAAEAEADAAAEKAASDRRYMLVVFGIAAVLMAAIIAAALFPKPDKHTALTNAASQNMQSATEE